MSKLIKIIVSIIIGILITIGIIIVVKKFPFIFIVLKLLMLLVWVIIVSYFVYSFLFDEWESEEFNEPMDLTDRGLHIYDYGTECVICGYTEY